MKKMAMLLLASLFITMLQAQNTCTVYHAEGYYYSVVPGVHSEIVQLNGAVMPNMENKRTNIEIYLFTTCAKAPLISFSSLGKKKIALQFFKVKPNNEETVKDENNNKKIITAAKGSFLWKANWSIESETPYLGKEKITIKGTIGSKKFTATILYLKKLQAVAMY